MMWEGSATELTSSLEKVDFVSTDVFDTLLLRTGRSERSRIVAGERLYAASLTQRGCAIDADMLVEARLQAQWLAFRALNVGARGGEVRLVDIVRRQAAVLALSEADVSKRLEIELTIEKASLLRNDRLVRLLRACRAAGKRVVAISDTTLTAAAVLDLIEHFCGPDLLNAVYTSADLGATKRDGDLFQAVARIEGVRLDRMFHVGDDETADVRVPRRLGVSAHHTPRPVHQRYVRAVDGAIAETGRIRRRRRHVALGGARTDYDARSFGRLIFGPIVAQFCLLIWLYSVQAEEARQPALLFCARGGLSIRQAFERVLTRLGLPLSMRRENFMVSRLVAARAALLAGSVSSWDEIGREFRGRTLFDVANALGGRSYQLTEQWRQQFSPTVFQALLFDRSGQDVLADIQRENALFTRHFEGLANGSDRLILCDTGLYGSTQRLLAGAFPNLSLETLHFARSNYKRLSEEHFGQVTGLCVESDSYNPLNKRTCVLRFWHLIESLFEPAIPTVSHFTDNAGLVTCNAGPIDFGVFDAAAGNQMFSGALAYIDALPADGGRQVLRDAETAWDHLHAAITRPTDADVRCLDIGSRSVDFGRADLLQVFRPRVEQSLTGRLRAFNRQLWREGAISREFPVLKHVLWPMLDSVHSLRGFVRPRPR